MAWRAGLWAPPDLRAETLIAAARRRTGLEDFGDPELPDRLARLTEALREEAGLTPLGAVMSHGGLQRALEQRLRAEAMLAADPAIERRPVAPPIVVLGPMRSGTTRVQRLLACDPRFVHTRLFETLTPCPDRPAAARRRSARALQWSLDRLNPAIRAIHPGEVDDAEEELGAMELALGGAQIEAQRPIPSWARWLETSDQSHVYRWLKRWMQLTGHVRGDDPAKPWILKTPHYLQDLPALIDVFPDARLVFTRRDPRRIVASAASLAWAYVRVQSRAADKTWCGREWLRKTAHRQDRATAFRAAHTDVPQIDIDFTAMNADWRGQMQRLYAFLDMELTPAALRRMEAYTARAARRHLARPHAYALAEFGLTDDEVTARLSA